MLKNRKTRLDFILIKLKKDSYVKVSELSRECNVSEVTIRKDLTLLEQEGHLIRNYSGAIPIKSLTRVIGDVDLMAKAASKLIESQFKIIIDNGSTTAALLPYLGDFSKLTVLTNSLKLANDISQTHHDITLLVSGGTYDPQSHSLQGEQAKKVVQSYSFDIFFTSADGIDPQRGTTTLNEHLGLSRSMALVSRQVVLLLSVKKLKNTIPNIELEWNIIDLVITDAPLDPVITQKIEAHGVKVVTAHEILKAEEALRLCVE